MRYLLVGNAPNGNVAAAASKADALIQINDCSHSHILFPGSTRYIFLTNTGSPLSRLVDRLYFRRNSFPNARIVLARNPAFYLVKRNILRALGDENWRFYQLSSSWTQLRGTWPIETVSFISTLRLELRLRELGMPPIFMPSTGMVAYDWLVNRLTPGDSLAVEGFTFQGWLLHPWQIERHLVQPRLPLEK